VGARGEGRELIGEKRAEAERKGGRLQVYLQQKEALKCCLRCLLPRWAAGRNRSHLAQCYIRSEWREESGAE